MLAGGDGERDGVAPDRGVDVDPLDRGLGGEAARSYDDDVPCTPAWAEAVTGAPRALRASIGRRLKTIDNDRDREAMALLRLDDFAAKADAAGLVFDSDPRKVSKAGLVQTTDPTAPPSGDN